MRPCASIAAATCRYLRFKALLHGDAIHVELGDDVDEAAARSALNGGIAGVGEIQITGREMHARADDGARSVPGVLAALETAGIPVASVTVARPSLDDVYLRYAGRTFSAAEAEAGQPDEKEDGR